MPKKTRKEKIIAEYHRRLATLQPKLTASNAASIPSPTRAPATYRLTLDLPQAETKTAGPTVYPQLSVIKKI